MALLATTDTGRTNKAFRSYRLVLTFSTQLNASTAIATLTRLRLSANLGVEDLARLIETAETEANASHLGPTTADQMMSRDLIQVTPDDAAARTGRKFPQPPASKPCRYATPMAALAAWSRNLPWWVAPIRRSPPIS